ncbi:nucleoid-associated protein [Ferruginibacter lapsinanis]|uniref:nucleoid-associated protein n=1 Tax=Ferruginibacter lapsinanis TaxID=563172 RepID=UPI001E48AF9F|nr:nucleoid-associated protein [Ferruginibacter lapsinanis]UEG48671.1 nucleoid-associated protein [Ferruginibacter lapsinanis]
MVSYFEASFSQLSIHKVGNKLTDDPIVLSEHSLQIEDEILNGLLMKYFLAPFEKVNEVYRLSHPTHDLNLNEVFHFAEMIFEEPESFHTHTQQIAKHLHDISNHPNIKSGELYCVYFKGVQIEGELLDAIGVFKSESKEPYLTVQQDIQGFKINYEEQAINIKKLDKGVLIFNTEKEEGYKVAIVDQTNRSEAVYWIDDFLKLSIRNDNYTQTQNTLNIYKNFVTKKMDEEFDISKTDKIDLLNRSIKYFKDKDSFDIDEFANEVIENPEGIELFKSFKREYENEYDTQIADTFSISTAAVKKQARVFKSVLKLDRNFHIYIHGDKELIEKGYDEEKNMNFYKVYFRDEQ